MKLPHNTKCRYCGKKATSANGRHCRNRECFIKDKEVGKKN